MPYIFSPELVESVSIRESINITHSDHNYTCNICSPVCLYFINEYVIYTHVFGVVFNIHLNILLKTTLL